MTIQAKGRTVIVRNGSSSTTHTFATPDEALDFAAAREEEQVDRAKAELARLVDYTAPGHPADPILPHPGELAELLASIWNFENPDDLIEPGGPPPAETDDGRDGLARAQTLAILDLVRAGIPTPDILGTVPDTDDSGRTDDDGWSPGLVDFEFSRPGDREDRVRVTLTSVTADPIVVTRTVVDPDGSEVRSGTIDLPPGRVLTRHYDLTAGQSIVFTRHIGNVPFELARFEAENTIDSAEGE